MWLNWTVHIYEIEGIKTENVLRYMNSLMDFCLLEIVLAKTLGQIVLGIYKYTINLFGNAYRENVIYFKWKKNDCLKSLLYMKDIYK